MVVNVKKIAIIGLAVAGIVAIGCATMGDNDTDSQANNQKKWQKQAPQLFNNVGYSKLVESAPKVADLPESLEELRGSITNPCGIRDDILEYIVKNIPSNNESAVRAAIKLAQYRQQIYFGNLSESDALILDSKENLAVECLTQYLHKVSGKDILKDLDDTSQVMKIMFNTNARDKHRWDVDNKYFSWKVLGTGLTVADEKIACQKGEF
jgi:hypothetical protein